MLKTFIELAKSFLLSLAQRREVKEFVIQLLAKYAAETDNKIDDAAVDMIREKLLAES